MKSLIVTGGVYSNLGKGIFTAGLASILRRNNLQLLKIDPYLNFHAGFLNPKEHGEVYVTQDGYQGDIDLGYYEKFLNLPLGACNNLTGGQINWFLTKKGFLKKGRTYRLSDGINDLLDKIIPNNTELLIVEIGGTIDDIESYWSSILVDQLRLRGEVINYHVVPIIKTFQGDLKTKPIQTTCKLLMQKNIIPNWLIVRHNEASLPEDILRKVSTLVKNHLVIPTFNSVYEISDFLLNSPLREYLSNKGLNVVQANYLNLPKLDKTINPGRILLLNKYGNDKDLYWHLIDGLNLTMRSCRNYFEVDSLKIINVSQLYQEIKQSQGVVLPGGFGTKYWRLYQIAAILAIRLGIPLLGICWGKQAIVNVLLRKYFDRRFESEEFNELSSKLCYVKRSFKLGGYKIFNKGGNYAGIERFRNRYHLTDQANDLLKTLVKPYVYNEKGTVESFTFKGNVFAAQFHPEFNCNILKPHQIFVDFISSIKKKV